MSSPHPTLPDPRAQPTVSITHAAALLGISRQSAYNAAADGSLPTLAFGRRLVVPTALLRRMLGLDVDAPESARDARKATEVVREADPVTDAVLDKVAP